MRSGHTQAWQPQHRPKWWPLEEYVNKQMDHTSHLRLVYYSLAAIAARVRAEVPDL